jgi:hypothetical protein
MDLPPGGSDIPGSDEDARHYTSTTSSPFWHGPRSRRKAVRRRAVEALQVPGAYTLVLF